MKKWLLFFISFIFIYNNIHADFLTEISKRDRNNPIYITEHSDFVLYARGSYLHTAYSEDGGGVPSIVAYQINTNGFIYNDAQIGSNIKKVPQGTYHIYLKQLIC